MKVLRILATLFAGPCVFVGVIWILQGINVLPGSFMTGHIIWAAWGVVAIVTGGALTWFVNWTPR